MEQLNFDEKLTTRWHECKRHFRSRFWNEIQDQIKLQVKDLLQSMISSEFSHILGAEPYQRTGKRKSKRNGFYTRSLESPVGRIEDIKIPRARHLDIRYSLFDRWQQVEDSVIESMLQAYLLGRSAACAQNIVESFGHSRFSRGFLARLTRSFENNLQQWLSRPITGQWPFLFIDALYVDVYEAGSLHKWCVLFAIGMDEQLNKEVLGFLVLKSESQEGTERLLRDLKDRGLGAPKLIIRDGSKAITNGAAMVFPHSPQQSCSFHKVKACGKYIQTKKHQQPFLEQAANIYTQATGVRSLNNALGNFKRRWAKKEPRALQSLLLNFEQTTTFLSLPKAYWRSLHTNNIAESFMSRLRTWTSRYGYYQGRGNLQMAIFTYLCHKNKQLVPNEIIPHFQKDTLLVA